WAVDSGGLIALVVVLDQFPRSLFRGTPRAFAGDPSAQRLSETAIARGLDRVFGLEQRNFLIMPFLHAEDARSQARAVALMDALVADAPAPHKPIFAMGQEQSRKYQNVIARFGRFPHRNEVLGRVSTPDEIEFLKDWKRLQPPSAFH